LWHMGDAPGASYDERHPLSVRKSYIRYNTRNPYRYQVSCRIRPAPGERVVYPMVSNTAKEVFILGLTRAGKTFRPSDWAERLAGVMSQFRPGGPQPGSHLGYSPWCVPTSTVDGVKCVVVHRDLRDAEPMAWDFCMNFARDNELQVREGDGSGQQTA